MTGFDEQVILIVGAGLGVGRAAALALAAHGARLALVDVTPINLDVTLAQSRAAGAQARDYICDVGKLMAAQTMIDQVLEDWGRIDCLVNCTAVRPHAPALTMDEWDFRRTLEVNLTGAFFLFQQVGRVMRQAGGGVVVQQVIQPEAMEANQSAFAASQAGLLALTQAAAQELAAYGIQVHALCTSTPGGEAQAASQILSLARHA